MKFSEILQKYADSMEFTIQQSRSKTGNLRINQIILNANTTFTIESTTENAIEKLNCFL